MKGNILISDNLSAKLTDFGVSGKVENKKAKRMSIKGSPVRKNDNTRFPNSIPQHS